MGQTSKTALKAFFNTGDIPTESQFADFIDSYENLVDSNQIIGVNEFAEVVIPTAKVTATPIITKCVAMYNNESDPGGAVLPAALPGRFVYVLTGGSAPVDIYALGTDNIGNVSSATPVQYNGSWGIMFFCTNAGNWSYIDKSLDVPPFTALILKTNLTQSGTADPTERTLVNTCGAYAIARSSAGVYSITFADITWVPEKVLVLIGNSSGGAFFTAGVFDDHTIFINTKSNLNVLTDALLNNTSIDIAIYELD